jgi:hypothetical protein
MIKKLLLGFMFLVSLSSFAKIECFVVTKSGAHIDFNESTDLIDSLEPFGIIKVSKANGRYHLSTIRNGEETIVSFKKKITITKQTPMGYAGGIGSLTCM